MKVKSTKSALLMSFTSLLLCFAMLIGSTFAWFTDSVTSGVNQIKAGNLDIEVSYKNDTTSDWKPLQGSESVFSKGLWEPGHTEFVTLKIENKGNLALNYKMMVSPVTETGGVNVSGQSFKLSDYLMFGVTDAVTTPPTYDRTTARAAVNAATKLNAITKADTMAAGADAQYVTLVVYMPETVGNEANYKSGTAAPEIELKITVLATQLESENDSFGNNYDAGAVSDSFYIVGPSYNYFPQISTTVAKAASGDTEITYSEKLNKDDTTATTLVKATVPAAALEENVQSITVTVKPQEAAAATTSGTNLAAEISAGREVVNFDVKISGVRENNTTDIPMEVFVGTGLSNVKVYHKGVLIAGATYDSATGIAKFNATTFSDYSFAYDAVCARIGEKTYGSLALAVAAAQSSETVTLLKDCAGNGIKVPSDKNFTIDFNGFTYNIDGTTVGSTGTETNGFQLLKNSTITFKNGKLTSDKAQILIQNYCNLTLENMVLDGTNLVGIRYALSNNCGETIIKNTTINAASNGVAFDSCKFGSYEIPTVTVTNSTINGKIELSGGKLNITSGTVNGEIGTATGYAAGDCSITGGTFSVKPDARFIAEGKEAIDNGNGTWTVGDIRPEAKIGDKTYATLAEAVTAAKSGDTIVLKEGEVTLYGKGATVAGKDLTFVGQGADKTTWKYGNNAAVSGEGGADYSFDGAGHITFKNLTLRDNFSTKDYYRGFVRSNGFTCENCKITNVIGYMYGPVEFKNCEFETNVADSFNVKCYAGTSFLFDGCTFKSPYGFIDAYRQNTLDGCLDITVKDCTFIGTGATAASKPAVRLCDYTNAQEGGAWNVYFVGTNTANNIATDSATGTNLYGCRFYDNAHAPYRSTVYMNDSMVWQNGAAAN